MSESDAFPITLPAASPDSHSVRFSFENTYARLPEHFYARLDPTPVAAPRLVKLNGELMRVVAQVNTVLIRDISRRNLLM